jgi:D-glycero-D-manno-heptose 1,7-bisphosphate phosphatase
MPDELQLCAGAAAALRDLRIAEFVLICVTNQPDVARGTLTLTTLDAINARLRGALPLDDLIVCAHDEQDGCNCRKPKPGMMLEGAQRHGIDLRRSYLVGDRWRDIDAGHAAGCRTVFIDRDYDERGPAVAPNASVTSIIEAARWILKDSA